jgi:hypothetical protein
MLLRFFWSSESVMRLTNAPFHQRGWYTFIGMFNTVSIFKEELKSVVASFIRS